MDSKISDSESRAGGGSPTASGTTIMLVDDDESVSALVAFTLEGKGYRLLKARNSDEALQIHDTFPDPIQLLIADQVMPPFLSGGELAQCIRLLRPSINVLYISGYRANPIVQDELGGAMADFLPKPFTPDLLLRKVQRMVGEPA